MGKSSKNSSRKEWNGHFPTGMRVLAVDDDVVCLRLLEALLMQCGYEVTATQHALRALELLRENSDNYDLVISDVQMPDMDGFKLLEFVGLEMDLPVIMLSVNGDTDIVMKGVMHGACDYLVKPVRLEQLRIIWKHVVKRLLHDTKEAQDQSSKVDHVKKSEDGHAVRLARKHRDREHGNKDEANTDSDGDTATRKRPRVSWSSELHAKFIWAVSKLGIDRAVPKKILDLMNVSGLTRENIASHLQKYRKALKKNGICAQHIFYGGGHSDESGANYPRYIQRGPDSLNLLERFKAGTHPSHGGIIPFHHTSYSFCTTPLFPLSSNHQGVLDQPCPSTHQTGQIAPHSFGYGSDLSVMGIPGPQSEFKGTNNQLLPLRRDQHDGYLQNLSLWSCGGEPTQISAPQLPYASNKECLDILLDKSNNQQEETNGSFLEELDSILSLQHEQQNLCPSPGADLDLGAHDIEETTSNWWKNEDSFNRTTQPELRNPLSPAILQHSNDDSLGDLDSVLKQDSSETFFDGTSQAELMNHPVEYSSKEAMFPFSKRDSEGDLHAILKQVRACS